MKNGYDNQQQAILHVTDYIWGYYCNRRPHTHNDFLTPAEKERQFNKNLLSCV